MKKILLVVLAVITVGAFFTSCNQSGGKYPGFKKTADGLYYKFYKKSKDTTKPKVGQFVEIEMIYGTPDSVLFNYEKLPPERRILKIPMIKSVFKGDIYQALSMMHVGDSAKFLMNADSVFKKLFRVAKLPPYVNPNEKVYFDIKLLGVKSVQEIQQEEMARMKGLQAKETEERNVYLKKHNIKVKPTASGLYIIHTKRGKGPYPKPGETVVVQYTGFLLNGTKFDSSIDRNKPFEFELGKHKVIAGWDEGIAKIRKGGSATLIIPSSLGYGPRNVGPIPPFSTLVFDVKVVNIKKTKK